MENNTFHELEKYNLTGCKTVKFDDEIYSYLKEKHKVLNSKLAIKEAESWESANKLVLTD